MRDWKPDESLRDFRERAAAAPILKVADRLGARLKRVGESVEWQGPCPACGGRLIVDGAKRAFNCRPSGAEGDVVAMVKHVRKLDYSLDAVEFINSPDAAPKA
jgi:hypothetical protein